LRAGKECASASHLRIGKGFARRIARLGESRAPRRIARASANRARLVESCALRRVTRGKSWQLIRILSVIM
jgi:hypothetical protein